METYTINEFSQFMKISKQTLRFYDKIQLITPLRGENGYRIYTDEHRLELQLVLLLKKGAFSLDSIRVILKDLRHAESPCMSLASSRSYISKKRDQLLNEIRKLQEIVLLFDETLIEMTEFDSCERIERIIKKAYESIF